MAGHTPGPWTEERDEYDIAEGIFPGWINGADGRPVVEYAGCGSHTANWPNPADKALVLAAPELLEACRAVHRCGNGGARLDRRASDMVRAAIAKAEGK